MNAFAFDIECRTGQLVDTLAVVFAFFINVKGLASGLFKALGIKRARFLGYDDRYALVIDSLPDRGDTLIATVRFDDFHMGDTDGANDIFNRYAAIACQVEVFHINARMGLMTGHRGCAVIQNDQRKIMVVKNGVDQAGYTGVEKGRITDKRNDFFIR